MQNDPSIPTREQILSFLEAGKTGTGFETNFVIKKFLELPVEKQQEIWEQIHSDDKGRRTKAARSLIDLVLNDLDGMVKFLNKTTGAEFDAWMIMPEQVSDKAMYIFMYFMTHLEQAGDKFIIKAIN